jgi:hypothetical protein
MESRQAAAAGLPTLNHLLQHTLRSLCTDSQWVYAVFWRILPRHYPPPKCVVTSLLSFAVCSCCHELLLLLFALKTDDVVLKR